MVYKQTRSVLSVARYEMNAYRNMHKSQAWEEIRMVTGLETVAAA